MKRRQALRSLLTLPAITSLPAFAQAPVDKTKPSGEKLPAEMKPAPVEEFPVLATLRPDAVAEGSPRFFSPAQMAALRRLASLMVPSTTGKPGAVEAGAPEFLDFLIGQSPADRQTLYRNGLDQLNATARRRFGQPFDTLAPSDAAGLLSPLSEAWTIQAPPDELSRFLHAVKEDVTRATFNSREWAAASQRRGSGLGTYWFPVE